MAGRGAARPSLFGQPGTRRAAILAIVVCALALTVAVPLRTYLAQQSDIHNQLAQVQALRKQVAHLQARKAQLSDPEQIRAEARLRLRYVMPGETPYVVQLPGGNVAGTKTIKHKPEQQRQQVWYQGLWHSVNGNGR